MRLVLHRAYPSLPAEGFLALAAAPPVVYITSATYTEVAQYVCCQLSLPAATVRLVAAEGPATGLATFQAMVDEDLAAGRRPLMCIANVHSTLFQM